MIEAALVLLLMGILFVVAVPLLVLGTVLAVLLKLVFAILLLPVKAIGWGVVGLFDGFLILMKLVGILLVAGVLILMGLLFIAVPLISLAPLLLLAGLVWWIWRMAHPARLPARS